MPFDFPATPTDGQVVTLGTTRYQWSAAQGAWMMQSGNVGPQGPAGADGATGPQGPAGADGAPGPTGGVTIEVSDTAPPTPADKSLWFQSSNGALWLRYPDPTSEKHWLQVNASMILPPADGKAYSMRNGVWTPDPVQFISSTTFAGKVRLDIPLPDGYKAFQIRYRNVQATTTSANYLWAFGSTDGTTFNMTDSAYNWRMIYTASTGTTAPQWVAAGGSAMGIVLMPLQLQGNALYNNSGILDIIQGVSASITNVSIKTQSYGTNGIFEQVGAGYLGVAGPWKAIRIQTGVGAGESYVRGDLDLYGYL